MNPNAADHPPPPPQQQQQPLQQPHRPSTSCHRHPDENFTGFCPACLCERLSLLDPAASPPTASSSRKSTSSTATATATAALKAIFKPSAAPGGASSRSGFLPELRRVKSFSASKNSEGFSALWEPQRKSCDVRVRNTLCTLFNQDDDGKEAAKRPETSEAEPRNLGVPSSSSAAPVQTQAPPLLESKEEGGSESEKSKDVGDIEIVEEEPNVANSQALIGRKFEEEIVEELGPEVGAFEEELKPMKDHIDLDSQIKKSSGRDLKKDIAGSFWSAASVFSKKLQKWRQKQKLKKRRNGGESARLPVEKPIGRQYRETQSEIADYGFGRRSCDTDPRFSLDAGRMSFDAARMSFDASRVSLDAGRMSIDAGRMSLDAGRMSFDDPRYSFEEPRASWDGYLMGRQFQRMPTMVSVVEDDAPVHVSRTDTQIPVEEPVNSINEDELAPGGTAQTRDYYADSSTRRRKSLDRSSSIRMTASAVVAEMDEMKPVMNGKVSPAVADYLPGPKLVQLDRDFRDSNSNSLRDDYSDTFEIGFRDNASVVMGNGDVKAPKKPRIWGKALNILAFMYRRSGNKDDGEDRYSRSNGNGVARSYSESWPELRRERNGDARGSFNPKLLRSNSSVSWRTAGSFGVPVGSARNNGAEANMNGRKGRDDIVLERNKSARYSPNDTDNGMLKLYLTPMGNSRRIPSGKSRPGQAHSMARSVLRMY